MTRLNLWVWNGYRRTYDLVMLIVAIFEIGRDIIDNWNEPDKSEKEPR